MLQVETFIHGHTRITKGLLSFGRQEWDCVIVHPSMTGPDGARFRGPRFQPTFGLSFPSRFTSPLRQFLEMFLKRGGGSSKNEVDKVQAGIRVAKNKHD